MIKLEENMVNIINKFSFKNKKQITFSEAQIVGNEIQLFKQNEFDKCIIL